MTAKQMDRWARWHRGGRTLFQCRNGFGSGLIFCALFFIFEFATGDAINWKQGLGMGAACALLNFVAAASIWQRNEAEFAKRSHPGS